MASSASPDAAAQAAEAERQRLEAERTAARESGVMMQMSGPGPQDETSPAATEHATTPTDALARMALDPQRDPNGQQRKTDFLSAMDDKGNINSHGLNAPVSPYTLTAGTVIAASLITGLNSDLPGLVTRPGDREHL